MTKQLHIAIIALLALFGLNLPPVQVAAQSQAPAYVPDEIIVRYRDGVEESKKDLGRFRVSGQRKKQFKLVPGLEVIKLRNVSVAEAIELYKQNPDVLYAEPNYILHLTAKPNLTATPNDPSFGNLWGLTKISAPSAWNVTTGNSNVVVGILDTGFDYTHPDLSANIFNNPNECVSNGVDNDGNGYEDDCHGIDVVNGDSDPMDDNNHGTHVAGTIGAVGNNSIGVVGVNWNVKMLSCKVFDANGSGSTDDAVDCLQYFQFMKNHGVNIVATNNSWGGGDFSQALYDAIDAQRQSDILFIAAAGNGDAFGIGQNNDAIPLYPCNYYLPNIICVAATTSNDSKAGFSNYGRHSVHVGAPGASILSTVAGGGYSSASGTSMATPHVAGLAALLKARSLDQNLNWDWRAIKNLILTGGNTVKSMTNTISGKRINANGSMTCSNTVVQSRVQPVANTISVRIGDSVKLGYLNIRCADPNGSVNVSVSSGGSITLVDDGSGADQAQNDGIYSGQWTPMSEGIFTITFPGSDAVTVGVGDPQISATPTTVAPGGTVNAAWSGIVFPNTTDWIGLYLVGAPHGSDNPSLAWRYTTGTASGSVPFVIPNTVAAGTYELRLFANDGYNLLAKSGPITVTVTPAPAATLSVSPTSIAAGGTVTASWSNIASPTTKDWIGLYLVGAPHGSANPALAWRYTTGTASGSVPFVIPTTVAAGTYELRLFANNGYTLLAKSQALTVTLP
jgi:hypothetical protein